MIPEIDSQPPTPAARTVTASPEKHAKHPETAPVRAPFLTPGVWILILLAVNGLGFALYRYLFGIAAVTNLTNERSWGLWIGIDVATGVALAAGGFTTAALAYIFHRDRFLVITRPALITAMLGYTFVALGLLVDLGRYYNIWHPLLPYYWQPNSVLFEVGLCVASYIFVLYFEFLPIVLERFIGHINPSGKFAGLKRPVDSLLRFVNRTVNKVMWIFIILGCVLSCLHQSSLGSLLLVAPTKLSPLWYTPILPLLFLLSAIATGFPMVVVESIIAAKSFRFKPEMNILSDLARMMPVLLWIYLLVKVGDMIYRNVFPYVFRFDGAAWSFIGEMTIGVIIPVLLLMQKKVRNNRVWLFWASFMVVAGVAWNRVNVFIVGFKPPFEENVYVPAIGEFSITVGLIAALILCYRMITNYFPVFPRELVDEARAARAKGKGKLKLGKAVK